MRGEVTKRAGSTPVPASGGGGTLVSTAEKWKTTRGFVLGLQNQVAEALPKHVDADRMVRAILTACQRNPDLLDCSQASLYGAILESAQLGLIPDPVTGEAALVPLRNRRKAGNPLEANLWPMYRGLIKLSRNSGEILKIYAREVYEGDEFEILYGSEDRLIHKPVLDPTQRGKVRLFYCVAHLRGGISQFDWMTIPEVDAIRARVRNWESGPWATDYVEMGKKTITKRCLKYLPLSTDLSRAIFRDEQIERSEPQDLANADAPTMDFGSGEDLSGPEAKETAGASEPDPPTIIPGEVASRPEEKAKETPEPPAAEQKPTPPEAYDPEASRALDAKVSGDPEGPRPETPPEQVAEMRGMLGKRLARENGAAPAPADGSLGLGSSKPRRFDPEVNP
jgi:recombination protein RecT